MKTYKPKVAYLIPNFQNPTGLTYSAQHRIEVFEAVKDEAMILVQDDPYGELRFEDTERIPYIGANQSDKNVYLGSFSKIVTPGMRLGYVIANKEKKISMAFQYIKGHTTTELMNRVFELIGEYQENGYVVLDYDAYSVNGRPYLALQVQTENNNLGDLEVYCDLGSGVLQTGILADKSNTIRDLIQTVDNMISSSISSFAVTDDSQVSDSVNYNLIDATDSRIFGE